MVNEQEKVKIHIREDMDVSQRTWLVAKLEQERGVVGAWFEGNDHHCLTVDYERNHFSHATLLDTIKLNGFHGEIVGA